MNKKLLIGLVMLCSVASLFAAGSTEVDELWSGANSIMDASSSYVAGERVITGESSSANVSVVPTYNGRFLEQSITGDRDLINFMNNFSDGGVLTPFGSYVTNLSYSLSETSDNVSIYDVKYAFDQNSIHKANNFTASGTIIGHDGDDYTGDITARLWIDNTTGEVIKLENYFTLGSISLLQSVDYTSKVINGETILVPTSISYSGTITSSKGGVKSIASFSMEETQDDFFKTTYFTR